MVKHLSLQRCPCGALISESDSAEPGCCEACGRTVTGADQESEREANPSDLAHSMVDPVRIAPEAPPQTIGAYRVIRLIGAGATGRVYEGKDDELGRRVALKVLAAHRNESDAVARFWREAKALARIDNENVVRVYGTSEHEGRPTIVMQLVEGRDLGEELEAQGPLSVPDALAAMKQVANGLRAAHNEGIVHRDVKPANLLRDQNTDALLVADFGLAREQSVDSSLTATGMVAGTPFYVAPEIIREGRGDHRADIYSFGATFFHLIAGKPPFLGKTAAATMFGHLTEDVPDLSKVRPGIPLALADLVKRCMAKRPEQRPQSYDALLANIEALIEGRPLAAPLRVRLARSVDDVVEGARRAISISPQRGPRITPRIQGERRPAGVARRLFATLIDASLILPMAVGGGALLRPWSYSMDMTRDRAFGLGVLIAFLLVSALFELFEASPGRGLLGLQLRTTSSGRPGPGRRFTRFLFTRPLLLLPLLLVALGFPGLRSGVLLAGLFLCLALIGFDIATLILDREDRSLADLICGTHVVQEKLADHSTKLSLLTAYMLWLPPLGLLGFHRFYLKQPGAGTVYLLSGGLLGLGWLFDLFALPVLIIQHNDREVLV